MLNRSIPRNTNAATVAWMLNFAAVITANPAAYGLAAGDATAINNAVNPYDAAWQLAGVTNRIPNDPANRTSPNVAAMNAARATALTVCGNYATIIQSNPNVLDADKLTAGVAPRNFTRTPTYVPATAPAVTILYANPGTMTLAFADSLTPSVKAKPLGATGLQLFRAIEAAPVVSPATAQFYSTFSANRYSTLANNPPIISFDPADNGKVCTFFARWVGKRGDVGPWSAGVHMTIAF